MSRLACAKALRKSSADKHQKCRPRQGTPDGPAPADNRGERDADRQGQKEEVVGF